MFEKYLEENKDLKFNFYSYSPPNDGHWYIDGKEYYVGQDFRTVERYKEYKDIGFNILFSAFSAKYYYGDNWETSTLKMVMDRAYEAGIKKIIILDDRIMELSRIAGGIVGDGKKFATQEDLEKFIADCFKDYTKHPAFYGIQLQDEPRCSFFEAIGQIFKAVRAVRPETFVQCNLLPLVVLTATHKVYPEGGDLFDRFKRYLAAFVDATGADYILFDSYPFTGQQNGLSGIYRFYLKSLQLAAEVCQEKKVKFYFVAQSTGMVTDFVTSLRVPTEAEMRWQTNMLMGFGVKEFAFWEYWNRSESRIHGEFFKDYSAVISREGHRTELYYIMKKVIAEMQELAPVILNFDYVADRYLINGNPFKSHPFFLEYAGRKFLENVVYAENSHEVALVNELYDKSNGNYLYMIENITDPLYDDYCPEPQCSVIKFKKQYTKIDIFENGKWRTEDLKDNTYTAYLRAGYAQFVLPY